jgi:hypothetical protein
MGDYSWNEKRKQNQGDFEEGSDEETAKDERKVVKRSLT